MSDAETRPEAASQTAEALPGLALLDRGLRFTYANEAFAQISGLSVDRHLGRTIGRVLSRFPDLVAAARATLETGIAGPPLELARPALPGTSAGPREWQVSLQRVTAGDEPARLGMVSIDVTQASRMRAQTMLQADRSRLLAQFLARVARAGDDEGQVIRLLATHAADAGGGACALFLLSEDGETAEVAAYEDVDSVRLKAGRPLANGTFALTGSSLESVVRTGTALLMPSVAGTDLEFGPPEWHAFRRRFPLLGLVCVPVCSGPKTIGAITVYRYETARPAFDDADVHFFQMLADGAAVIIDVARAHRALADSARRMALIVDESPLATILVDRGYRVQAWNRAAEEMFGWSENEVLGKPIAIEPVDLKDEIQELRRRTIRGVATAGLETRRLRRDGTEIGVALYEAPLRDAEGTVTGAVLLLASTLERRRLEEELVQARKMEIVGRLAGGVAHDFNNILTVLLGYSSLLAAEAEDPDGRSPRSELIGDVVKRAGGLTQQLLAFSRRQESKVSVLDANETVLGMKPLILRLVGESVEVVVVDREHRRQAPRRPDAAPAGHAQPGGKCPGRDAFGRPPDHQDGRGPFRSHQPVAPLRDAGGGLRHDLGHRHGHRHGRGDEVAPVRTLLHHKGRRPRARASAWPRATTSSSSPVGTSASTPSSAMGRRSGSTSRRSTHRSRARGARRRAPGAGAGACCS